MHRSHCFLLTAFIFLLFTIEVNASRYYHPKKEGEQNTLIAVDSSSDGSVTWYRAKKERAVLNFSIKRNKYHRIIQVQNSHPDSVFLYKREGENWKLAGISGNYINPEMPRNTTFATFRTGTESAEYLLITKLNKDRLLPLAISPEPLFHTTITGIYLQLGLYYGAAIMMFIVNFCIFLVLKDRKFLYYCMFLLFFVASLAYSDGLGTMLKNSWWLNNAELILYTGLGISGILFASAYLEYKPGDYTILYISSVFVACAVICFILHLFFKNYLSFFAGKAAIFIALFCFFIKGLQQFKYDKFSRIFVFAYGLLLIFFLECFIVRESGYTIFNFTAGQLKVGSFIEMIILTYAIAYRFHLLKQENLNFRTEINHYLAQENFRSESGKKTQENIFDDLKNKHDLTDREIEILKYIFEGDTNAEIAEKVFLSVHTVKYHTKNIYFKLDIKNRSQAVSVLSKKL